MYFFANWKLSKSFVQTKIFLEQHAQELQELAVRSEAVIGLAPSAEQLYLVAQTFKGSAVMVGAQHCSQYGAGKYTGEVSAYSLQEAGATFCLVGHTERASYFGETGEHIAQKLGRILESGMSPVICFGETWEEKQRNTTIATLLDHLEPLFSVIAASSATQPIFFSYEPVYAVGTGVVPDLQDVRNVCQFFYELISFYRFEKKIVLLYGGSVTLSSIEKFKTLPVEGFLIGNASLDFQEFKNIVVSCSNETNKPLVKNITTGKYI